MCRMVELTDRTVDELVAERTAELRRAWEASEARFRALIENSADVVAVVDANAAITFISASVERELGYTVDEVMGAIGFGFAHEDDAPRLRQQFFESVTTGTDVLPETFRARHRDGSWRNLEGVGVNMLDDPAVSGIVYTLRDVTAQHQLQLRLQQAERLEAVGQLAGGIAHDFNNILLVIRGYSSVLRGALSDPQLVADVDEIASAADRAAELTRQLLAFSRRQVMQPELVDVSEVVRGMEKLLHRSIREDVEMRLEVPGTPMHVLADSGQMEQVLLNLVVNARDAMPDGGALVLRAGQVCLESSERISPALEPGEYVALSISDTGSGISPDDLPRIFEPFFTTKSDGLGTGLGLSTVYGIVAQSGGGIEVRSEPGAGTTFVVYLPTEDEPGDEKSREAVVLRLPAGSETVLLVEDEEPVRELVRRVLEDVGYHVLAASRPSEAQRLAAESEIDLLLTDVVMPEMSGYELATRVRLARPDAHTLFMSGYAHKALGDTARLPGGELLRKPFSPEELTAAVRAVLDGRPIA
jgi:two-component system, cell cycle sensor histidine kinase and response regulator CckA